MDPPSQVSGPDQGDANLGTNCLCGIDFDPTRRSQYGGGIRSGGIVEQNCEAVLARVHDDFVCLGRFFERNAMRDQALEPQALLRSQAQELFHVALFCPADVRKRVVLALAFIAGIVAARTVRPCHEDLDLFQITLVPGKVEFDCSHVHDATAIAANFHRQPAGRGRLSRSRDDGAIDADSSREGTELLRKLRTAY